MEIYEYMSKDKIMLDMISNKKEKAIKELAECLKNSKEISDFNTFLSDVFVRESVQTTGIGNEVAIPHARTDTVNDFIIAFGRSKDGVDFDSPDAKPVKLIFLMGTPNKKNLSQYLKALGHLSRILNKEDFRNKLLSATSADEVINEFRQVVL